ncbi:fructosamine kinase family protein [Galbitalea sp. SE-J8]|uniref:fructosamine kinase family protein n=1 Tax=Galbitalea sp. SE-J8 TaxID=3054952 RepID=UPI00259CD76F|nr:fructosamine kinase family protein [Galbitalea sp. SE-J8]MDM4762590.1 fructosamine kinase family protein [Galbitalea sp. SE-J8]
MGFVKRSASAPAGFFEAEAAGLAWLAEAEECGGCRIARVESAAPDAIELERVTEGRATPAAARAFGAALARTHGAGAPGFGWAPGDGPIFIGSREMPRTTAARWGEFYASGRVEPFLDIAVRAGSLRDAGLVREACALVASGAFDDDAPPARIHGDLWNGNVLWAPDGVVLIDPAAHGGHGETDLAMLALFGCPYLETVIAGYEAVRPLRARWRERVPVHQLHPLAVHAAGHGPHYGVALEDAARRTLALG